ncbi:MAG: glycosyltransferase family 2 protein [Phycisphaerales bacterium]|nr:glycosyltransferase family 2 protein [Phycisphaerales bacterium]
MPRITATIITLNEARNLKDCVDSLSGLVDEVLVLDSCSTDGTQDLARSLGAVVHEQPYAGNGPQRIRASALASNDWILAIDADERLEPDLQEWLRDAEIDEHSCYAFRRRNFLGDHWIRAAGFYPDEVVRLYNRRTAEYLPSAGHSRVAGDASRVSVRAHLRHLTFRDMAHWRQCLEWMTTRDAEAYVAGGGRVSPLAPLMHAVVALLRKLIGKGGAFQGRDGWRIAWMTARRAWMKYSKIRSLQRTRPAGRVS